MQSKLLYFLIDTRYCILLIYTQYQVQVVDAVIGYYRHKAWCELRQAEISGEPRVKSELSRGLSNSLASPGNKRKKKVFESLIRSNDPFKHLLQLSKLFQNYIEESHNGPLPPAKKHKFSATSAQPATKATPLESFPWKSGGHGSRCGSCQEPGVLLCCELCPGAYHVECATPPLAGIPEDDWYCVHCIQSGASQAIAMTGEDLGAEHMKAVILLYSKRRWNPCFIVETPKKSGIVLVKFWRADGREGALMRVNLKRNKVLLLSPAQQEVWRERLSLIDFSSFVEKASKPSRKAKRPQQSQSSKGIFLT